MYNIYHNAPHTKGNSEVLHFLLFIILIIYLKVRLIVFVVIWTMTEWLNKYNFFCNVNRVIKGQEKDSIYNITHRERQDWKHYEDKTSILQMWLYTRNASS
jgi:hypothetical protein